MIRKIIRSFINAIVELTPLIVCSLLCSAVVCTVLGLSLGIAKFPTFMFYTITIALFTFFYIALRIHGEAHNKVDCYMQAAVSGTFIGLLNSELLKDSGLIDGFLGDPYWEYKLVFFVAASFWHGLIMLILFKTLKKKKAASIRMQPQFDNLD